MKKNFFKKLTTTTSLLFLATANQMSVLADSKNPLVKTGKDIKTVGDDVQALAYIVAGFCFILAGGLLMLGDTAKKKGITWLPSIIAGLFVISLAAAFVGYIRGLGG
jgi:hypothetical protein